jgi:shikimate kinase
MDAPNRSCLIRQSGRFLLACDDEKVQRLYRRRLPLSTTQATDARAGWSMTGGLADPDKPIVLVGLMGAGKTCIGRRLARRLGMTFVDADEEIVKAARASVSEIFHRYGEAAFRDGERRVIARLLDSPSQVLATGGGAFIDPATREMIQQRGVSVWLRAELDVLEKRTKGRSGRPLLATGDARATLALLMDARYPIYAQANLVVDTRDEPPEVTTLHVLNALRTYRSGVAMRAEAGA